METIILVLVMILILWKIYEFTYFNGEQFKQIKEDLQNYVSDCNAMNRHIESLKRTFSDVRQINYGTADFNDSSVYNFKRKEMVKAVRSRYIYDCSATVCKNAGNQPFKYLCKYFDIKANEETLESFEDVLNNFSAAEEGKMLLKEELESIEFSISKEIPPLIEKFCMKKFMEKVGFKTVDLSDLYFPMFSFRYVSPGGNKSDRYDIRLDVENLNAFVEYLSNLVKFNKSTVGQRSLMTSKLRTFIKERDSYTCQKCGISTAEEANLLLEIDHIVPLSKGGLSIEENLQTLCWRCNRTKGSKLDFYE